MAAAGVTLLDDLTRWAAIGLLEVLKHYGPLKKMFDQGVEYIKNNQPSLVILVDYPGFNIRFAKKIKKLNVPVLYYISPQIWAWGRRRARTIARVVDKMLVFLPFEPAAYKHTNLDVEFVGHPLLDRVQPSQDRDSLRKNWQFTFPTITLAAGSRRNEVKKLLPVMLESAKIIQSEFPSAHFILLESSQLPPSLYDSILKRHALSHLTRIQDRLYDVMTASDFALVASGTATLETALCRTPFVILYKVASSTYWLARALIQIPYIGLVNVVAGKKIVPEFIQYDANPKYVSQEALYFLKNQDARDRLIHMMDQIRKELGPGKATERAARAAIRFLEKKEGVLAHP
jgi:lipid-A-disaccharide synthase